jgi:hypothetical protein
MTLAPAVVGKNIKIVAEANKQITFHAPPQKHHVFTKLEEYHVK